MEWFHIDCKKSTIRFDELERSTYHCAFSKGEYYAFVSRKSPFSKDCSSRI